MLNGPGFVNLMWMFVGIWIGIFLARALPVQEGNAMHAPSTLQTVDDR